MTADTMISRVARAICQEVGHQPYENLIEQATYLERKSRSDWPIIDKQEARQVARAAIEAMREPTLAMRKVSSFKGAEIDWPAMIDAALAEGEGA